MGQDTTAPTRADEPGSDLSLWQVIAPVNKQIYVGMALFVIGVLGWFAAIWCLFPIASEITSGSPDVGRIWLFVGLSLAGVIIAFAGRVFSFYVSHLGAFALEEILRTELSGHLARVPLGYVVSTGSGTLKKVLHDDVRALHAFVADSTPLFAKAMTTPLVGIIAMFIIDWRLALISLTMFPIALVGMRFAFTDYADARIQVDQANAKINGVIIEYVQGMQVVRTFDDGSGSFRRYEAALRNSTEVLREWTSKSQLGAFTARTLFAALPTVLVLLAAGVPMYRADMIDAATLTAFLLLAPTVTESIVPIVWLQQFITNASASVKRLGALRAVEPLPEAPHPTPPADASVRLENVTFRYDGRDDDALRDVTIDMSPGSVTALVGPSGAGKSTVAQLILRFWDVAAGSVQVGGVDVRQMSSDQLMSQVAFVFQSPFLLHDSIRENIRLGKPDSTDAEVEQASRAAQAHDFILDELPHGYDTVVGERGSTLSGGQRQRITIARAILQDSPIIVLDEATAFADPDNEAKIHQALAELAHGKTLIVVAHRLSTIRDADQVVVLDRGRVVETGHHDDLVAAGGLYASLWGNFEAAQGWTLRHDQMVEAK